MPELNYENLLELGKEYVKERPISFQSFSHYDFFEWLRLREASQAGPDTNLLEEGNSLYRPSEPMVQIEMAARTVFDKFSTEWPKVERDLKGCRLQVTNSEDGKSTKWVVKGMPAERAEIYNERYAKPFGNALVGVLNIETVTIEFEVKGLKISDPQCGECGAHYLAAHKPTCSKS